MANLGGGFSSVGVDVCSPTPSAGRASIDRNRVEFDRPDIAVSSKGCAVAPEKGGFGCLRPRVRVGRDGGVCRLAIAAGSAPRLLQGPHVSAPSP
jgi:hypothetical protein